MTAKHLGVHALVAAAAQLSPADLILGRPRPGRGRPRPPRPLRRTFPARPPAPTPPVRQSTSPRITPRKGTTS